MNLILLVCVIAFVLILIFGPKDKITGKRNRIWNF